MTIFYRIFYAPLVNRIFRNAVRLMGNLAPRKLKVPVSGLVRLEYAAGKHISLYTNPTNSMSKLIYWSSTHNHEYTDIFTELIKDMAVFIDIGASIGYYTLVGKKENPNLVVHCFEPGSGPHHYLEKNILHNQLKNTFSHQLALAQESGELSFFPSINSKFHFLEHQLGGTGSLNVTTNRNPKAVVKVKTVRLDDFIENANLDGVDLIKMDTEGTENYVIEGGLKSIRKFRPIIISEVLFGQIENELDILARDLGYLIFRHDDDGLFKLDSLSREEDDGGRNYFFVPPEKEMIVSRFSKV